MLVKRALDVVVGGMLGLTVMPLGLLIAVAIRLDSRGPALFRQVRVGQYGRPLVVLKFRTMTADAHLRRAELMAESLDGNWLHLERDPRVTRVGRFLRHTSLDELPQLMNVLRGEMSLVGPRPLIPEDHENVPDWANVRSTVKPGLTGLWQTMGRTRLTFDEMIALDCRYAAHVTVLTDFKLLLATVPAVLLRRGAN